MAASISDIAKRMALEIPKPKAKTPKPAKSYRQLKPGQYITNIVPLAHGEVVAAAGTLWYVAATDSGGASLRTVGDENNPGIVFKWTHPEWKNKYFVRARKPRKAKAKTTA